MAISPLGSAASSTQAPLGLLCWLFCQRISPRSPAGMPLYIVTIPNPLPTVSTHSDPEKFTRCDLQLASGEQVSGYVSTVCWPPVRLYGDLCTERMNVHLVLHLHILSGSM